MSFNPILATDSYKLSHYAVYPSEVKGMSAYIEARTGGKNIIIPFGLQMFVKKFLSVPITKEHIDEAEAFAKAHGEPFNRAGFEHIVEEYLGYWPVKIYAAPEGSKIPSGNAIVVIECDDAEAYWVVPYLETALQRAVWYPTTIASNDYQIKLDLAHFYRITGADPALLPFALHDFGARGVSSAESAEIGGAAHLVNFMGSDTIEGIVAANKYYNIEMAAFSVPASEHSVECAFGEGTAEEIRYLETMLDTYAKPGKIVSIVIDGYDYRRAAQTLCDLFKDKIISSGAKVVFRPDSGDMMETVPAILAMQERAFGSAVTAKGYRKINNVGIIQGDGVNHMTIKSLLGRIAAMGYSADNVVFGSGGALLQVVNRDTYRFAQKVSAILVGDEWLPIFKTPWSDPSKASKGGRMDLIRSRMTGEYMTVVAGQPYDSEFESVLKLVYYGGVTFADENLATIRARCAVEI